jgi:MFS family permease
MPPVRSSPTSARIPRGVWALGFVSLFMDVSSEMIHALLPVFLVGVLGASVTTVGLLEGTAEAIASVTKVFSGTLSDRLGKRKALTLLGYGLAAITKPVFALAPTAGWVFVARATDRIGKGIRGAPRDALVADLVPPETRGAAFGLRQTLDTVGAFAGPLLAIALMAGTGGDFRSVFWFATIPALVSVLVLVVFVHEPTHVSASHAHARPSLRALLGNLSAPFWWLVAVAALFTLARFSEAFLILRSTEVGLDAAYVPAVLVVMNVAYALSAYPAGWVSDRMNRWGVFAVGAALLVGADLVLAYATSLAAVAAGTVIWGLHMGFTQGLLAALVADAARPEHRGTAFGVFNFVTGMALLAASVLAGILWDSGGARLTFLAGAALTTAAGVIAAAMHFAGMIDGRAPRRRGGSTHPR